MRSDVLKITLAVTAFVLVWLALKTTGLFPPMILELGLLVITSVLVQWYVMAKNRGRRG